MNTSCERCGESLFPEDRFCPSCGTASSGRVAVVTPPSLSHPGPESSLGGAPAESTDDPVTTGPVTDDLAAEDADTGPANRTRVPTHSGASLDPQENWTLCTTCQNQMAEVERFCPKCGTPRAGVEAPARPLTSWQRIRARLEEVTAGRYRILEELGRGGMAAVYLAHEIALDRKVAIKVMRPGLMLDEGMVGRFLREARTMASFHHPNIVTVHAVESAEDLHYFVMQYVPGMSLDRIIKARGSLPIAAVQSVIYQAASALGYAHRAGVIHRDVKPANILIDENGNAVVTDFGIAKTSTVEGATVTTSQMGTPQYMSPEQCNGKTLTPASDQYALGNVAYEMLTGEVPFKREGQLALALAITNEKPRPVDGLRKDCPPAISAAVLKMLAKAPAGRWPSLTEAASAIGGDHLADDDPVRAFLASLAKAEAPRADGSGLTPRRPKTSTGALFTRAVARRRVIQLVVPIAVAVIGVGTGLYAYWRSTRRAAAAPPAAVVAIAPDSAGSAPTGLPAGDTASAPRQEANRPAPPPPPAPAPETQRSRPRNQEPAAGRDQPATPLVVVQQPPETVVVTREVPAAEPAPAPPPAVVPPPAPVSYLPEVRRTIDRYVAAINARSLTQLKAVFPTLRGDQEARWRDLFGDEIETISATSTVRGINEQGTTAEARFLVTLTFKPKRGDPQSIPIETTATVQVDGGVGRIIAIRSQAGR
ncbi:MAG: protein kinase [Gemmatimonadales bacterium]